MKAELLLRESYVLTEDTFVEMRIWRVPAAVEGSAHDLKYALTYVVAGQCVLRYDNEAGKGDHRHLGAVETPYRFTTPESLLADFWSDVEQLEARLNTVTLSVASSDDVRRRALGALRGEAQGAYISFASAELLWKVLTAKRWELLKAMTGQGAMAIREVARRVGRDVKAVHGDVHALLDAGVLERTAEGLVIFPYDAVRVDFTLTKAA